MFDPRRKEKRVLTNSGVKQSNAAYAKKLSEVSDELQIVQLELEMQNSELKASYEALEKERLKLSNLFQLAPVGYLILNSVGVVVDINQTGLDMLDLNSSTVINQRFQTFVQPGDLEAFHHFLYKMQKTGGQQSFDMNFQRDTQTPVILQLQGLSVDVDHRMASKKELMYHITFNDVTQNRTDQQQLIEAKERLEMTLNASSAGIWSLDASQTRFYLDDYSMSMLGLKSFEFFNSIEQFTAFVAEDDKERVSNSFRNAIFLHKEIDVDFKASLENSEDKFFSMRGHFVQTAEGGRKIAGVLMDITDKKNLQLNAEQLQVNQQKVILDAILKAQEKERKKVSEALHDSVCQLLYGINLNMQALNTGQKNVKVFNNINQLLNQAIKETRNISYDLTPSVLLDFGFRAGIMELVQRLSTPAFVITVDICERTDELPKDLQLSLFRIVQELLNNSMKHSEASGAVIEITSEDNCMSIKVSDNGRGMVTPENLQSGSGLRGVKNRVYLLNGNFNIKTAENNGMEVTLTFDINSAISSLEKS